MTAPLSGILCVDKPPEMTSFSCCGVLRHCIGGAKVGHAGTLDPMATGVLPLLVGTATRVLDWLPAHDKRYHATVQFGLVSDTQDIWGTVTSTGAAFPSLSRVESALSAFRGEVRQVPPMMSALKRNGVRLYDLARQGIDVDREARLITVYHLSLETYDEATGIGTLDCLCSKGTYIRTLCADLGDALGCGAVMAGLRRTMAAGFTLDDCLSLADVRALSADGTLPAHLLPVDRVLTTYPAVSVTAPQAVRFANGGELDRRRVTLSSPTPLLWRVYDPADLFLGLGRLDADALHPVRLFAGPLYNKDK